MSRRTRTISWMEGRILAELSKRQAITTYLALSALVLKNVRSIEEQHNMDIALTILLTKKEIIKDDDGFTIFKLVA